MRAIFKVTTIIALAQNPNELKTIQLVFAMKFWRRMLKDIVVKLSNSSKLEFIFHCFGQTEKSHRNLSDKCLKRLWHDIFSRI